VSFPPKSLAGSGERRQFTFHPARLDRPRDVANRAQEAHQRSAQAAQAVKAFAEEQARAAKSAQGSSSSSAGGALQGGNGSGRSSSSNGGLSRQRSMTEILNEKREQWELHLPPKVAAALESSAMKALAVVTKGASSVLVLANMLTSEALANDEEYAEVRWLYINYFVFAFYFLICASNMRLLIVFVVAMRTLRHIFFVVIVRGVRIFFSIFITYF